MDVQRQLYTSAVPISGVRIVDVAGNSVVLIRANFATCSQRTDVVEVVTITITDMIITMEVDTITEMTIIMEDVAHQAPMGKGRK